MYRYILLFILVSIFSFCGEKQDYNESLNSKKYTAPVTITAGAPTVTPIASEPYRIIISGKGAATFDYTLNNISETIVIKAPAVFPLADGDKLGLSYIENYSTKHGLALNNVSCGIRDRRGNLWFGTSGGGVSRYDGKTFTNFTSVQGLAGNLVKCIAEDSFGNIWFVTNGSGVSKYNGRFFVNYTTADGLANDFVKSIAEDNKGNMWFGTNEGVSKFEPLKPNNDNKNLFVNYTTASGLINNNINSSLVDQKGNLWFGTSSGVSKYNGQSFINYLVAPGLASNIIMGMAEDKNKHIWFATRDGVSEYSPERDGIDAKGPFTNYYEEQGLGDDYVHAIYHDNGGNVWFAHGAGLSRYSTKSKTFTDITVAQGLSNNLVYSITEDREGNMWFGSAGNGLDKYYNKPLTSFSDAQGRVYGNTVWCFNEDNAGNLWIGTSSGVGSYNGNCFSNHYLKYVTASVRAMFKDKSGALWWGGTHGVCKYDGEVLIVYGSHQGLNSKSILSILEDSKGSFWFGTYGGGVIKFDGESFINYTQKQGLANDVVKCITEDLKGNIYFGTNGKGISKFDGVSFTNYSTEQGLGSNIVLSSLKDRDGNLWFGTFGGGVSRFDGDVFTNYTTTQGIANDVVYAIAEDTVHNMLWFGTNLGLSGLKRKNIFSETTFENFNLSTGFPIKDINTGALFVDSKGVIWAGSNSAMHRFDYSSIRKNSSPPEVFIQSIKVQNENVSWYMLHSGSSNHRKTPGKKKLGMDIKRDNSIEDSLAILNEEVNAFGHLLTPEQRSDMSKKYKDITFDSITNFYPVPVNLALPFTLNNITFDFGSIETDRPQLVRYQFYLEGYDKDWSPVTEKSSATYGNIQEGKYTFKIKARNVDGVWSEPVLYSFRVVPPWYRTWWMYLIYSVTVLAAIGLFFRWRTASLRKEKQMLEQIVKKRTAEVVEQKELVEEKQKEILDSINYAKRIQYALLAHNNLLKENLKEFFVLFQPKDIVSGDFYWATTITETDTFGKKISRFYLAVCDSTGHGVPGAFMSLLNISFLNEAINEKNIKQPNEILNHVRKRLIENISQEGAQDGMDGILVCLEYNDAGNNKLTYAASNNAPVIVRNNTIIYLPADKMPVGKGEQTHSFTLHSIDIEKQDVLYLFTDGYADQFGGPKSKKFKYKQLEDLLITIHKQPMGQQQKVLEGVIKSWMGNLEQVDDILIVGLQID